MKKLNEKIYGLDCSRVLSILYKGRYCLKLFDFGNVNIYYFGILEYYLI